jgi:hypothetical protein
MSRNGRLAEAPPPPIGVNATCDQAGQRAFAGCNDRPVMATPISTSANPAQAEGAMGSASATARR